MKVYIHTFGLEFFGNQVPPSPLNRPWDLCVNIQHLIDPQIGIGTDPKVQMAFLLKNFEEVESIIAFAVFMVKLASRNFSEAAIAINCRAGHARSVAMAELLADYFREENGYEVEVTHLTIER